MFQKWRNPGESRKTMTSEELLGFKSLHSVSQASRCGQAFVWFGMILYGLVWHSVIQASRGGQGTKFSPWLTEHALAEDHFATQPDGLLFSHSFLLFLAALVWTKKLLRKLSMVAFEDDGSSWGANTTSVISDRALRGARLQINQHQKRNQNSSETAQQGY